MKRYAIYKRVSTEEQIQGSSLDTQDLDCHRLGKSLDAIHYQTYADEGLSGRKGDRPGLTQLRADAAARKFNIVIVWKSDRLARDIEFQFMLAKELWRSGVELYFVEGGKVDLSNAAGHISFAMQAEMAEVYSILLSGRMERALSHNIAQGLHNGPVPIGYRRGADGVLVATDDAPAVVAAFDLYRTRRYTYDTLADALNERGYTALDWRSGERKPFSRESVRFLLKNKTYIGQVQHKGAWFPGQHAPLISQERFEAVQTIMEDRSSWRGVPIVHAPPRILHGLTWCEDCRIDDDHANKMWLHYSGKNGQTGYYRCAASRGHACTQGKASARRLELTIINYLEQMEAPLSLAGLILEQAYQLAETAPPAPRTTTPQDLEQKRQRLTSLWTRGLLPDHEYEQALISLQEQPEPTQPATRSAPRINSSLLQTLITDIPRMIRQATADERRAVVQEVFERVWIGEKDVKALTPTMDAYPLLASVATLRRVGAMGWPMGLQPGIQPTALLFPLRMPRKLAV